MTWLPVSGPTTRDSQGEQTNPTTTVVLADTDRLMVGQYEVLVVLNTSANAQFVLQHRNAANDGAIGDNMGVYVPANNPTEVRGIYDFLHPGERLRVMMDGDLTGTAWVTIFARLIGLSSTV